MADVPQSGSGQNVLTLVFRGTNMDMIVKQVVRLLIEAYKVYPRR